MDESQQKIEDKLLEILSKEILSISELSRRLNVKRYILAGYLEALREQGKVDVFKVGKAKVYVAKEKAKKGLWLIFFLALIPFFLPMPTLADISVNFTPSNKIWIINSNGAISYNPAAIVVEANCNITYAYIYDSEGTQYIIGTNRITNNKLSFDVSSLNKDLLASGINYSLSITCDNNDSTSMPLNVSYIEASLSIIDSVSKSNDLFEDSTLGAILKLKENGNFLSPIEEKTNLNI
ncbi:MAG: helix-turn-helix domain-containing protein, partial [Candidatus Aenigmarchaeota archaeon]|nr:helix-turn-helix domain-containing protein [Candidatus Aenigmarchaeota archaeon]